MNIGYGAVDYAPFLKACDDVRNNVESEERTWFLFSDKPEPMDKPHAPFFLQDADGRWVYSERAGCYFWVKWFGMKGDTILPQFNFGSESLQREYANSLAMWRDVGFDGFMVDAVNWYVNCDWHINERAITGPIHEKGELWVQPEGAGGFKDDPVPWIIEGRYNCVQDYSLYLWWENVNVLGDAIAAGNPGGIEKILAGYRDRVVDAGGVCYVGLNQADAAPLPLDERQLFELALLIGIGEMICVNKMPNVFENKELHDLLKLQSAHPALWPTSSRIVLDTQDNDKYLAMLKQSADSSETILSLYNFSGEDGDVEAKLPGGRIINRRVKSRGYSFDVL
jgi:glycosidase